MNLRINSYLQSPLVKNTVKLASSNVLLYLIPLVVTPILTRLYDPYFFGEWGVFSGTSSIVSIITMLCYEHCIILAEKNEVNHVLSLNFVVCALMTLITGVIMYAGKIFGWPFFIDFPSIPLLLVFIFSQGILVIFQNIANRHTDYWIMSIGSLIQGCSQALFRILLGIWIIASNGLITGTVIASIIALLFITFKERRNFKADVQGGFKIQAIKETAVKYKKFPLYDAPASLLLFATFNLMLIILSLYYPRNEIGCLSVIQQLLLLPISFVGSAMGRVFYQEITESGITQQTIERVSVRMVNTILFLSSLPTLFLACGGDKLVAIILGSKWTTAAEIALCLSIWSIPTILTQPLLPLYRKYNKQNRMLAYNILNFVLGVGAIIVTCSAHYGLLICIFAYAVASSFAKFLMFLDLYKLSGARIAAHRLMLPVALISVSILILAYRLTLVL